MEKKMRKLSTIIAFILFGAPLFASPPAYTLSDPLTPLDPTGSNLIPMSHYKEVYRHGSPRRQVVSPPPASSRSVAPRHTSSRVVSSRVLETYKKNLLEALSGKKAPESSASKTMPKAISTSTLKIEKPKLEEVKDTPLKKQEMKDELKKEIKEELKRENVKVTSTEKNLKIEDKKEDVKVISTETKKETELQQKDKKPDLPNAQNMLAENPSKEIQKKDKTKPKKLSELGEIKSEDPSPRVQNYDGGRPQLWYGGPWKRG